MRITGIIAEYNPFHNGHQWHIAQARRATGCDGVVVCMDGHFTQRGEPAIQSKWDRTRAALNCGADAVFELPALYAVRCAEVFARSGVAILGGLGVDALCYGSEIADPGFIEKLAMIHEKEPTSVSLETQRGLSEGKTYARARGEAISKHLGVPADVINHPNLILATEYVRAIRSMNLAMESVPVPRRGNYHGVALGAFASASAIRAAFAQGRTDEALACLPGSAQMLPDRMHSMDDLLMFRLREMSLSETSALPDISEGLERRLFRLCRMTGTRDELLEALKCKRYTHARLSRMLTHALLGMDQKMAGMHPVPTYARLLGMRRDAGWLMTALSERSTIPIVSNPTQLKDDPVFQLECRATDTWALLHDDPERRLPGREFTEKFIIV